MYYTMFSHSLWKLMNESYIYALTPGIPTWIHLQQCGVQKSKLQIVYYYMMGLDAV